MVRSPRVGEHLPGAIHLNLTITTLWLGKYGCGLHLLQKPSVQIVQLREVQRAPQWPHNASTNVLHRAKLRFFRARGEQALVFVHAVTVQQAIALALCVPQSGFGIRL